MADRFSKRKRSEIMSRIRSTGTKPEERLYRIARTVLGHRPDVKKHVSYLPGNPDLYIPSLRLALFADGCFFHGCPTHGHIPKSNEQYWKEKISRNCLRDKRSRAALRRKGVSVWRCWEHDLQPSRLPIATKRVKRAILKARLRANTK